MPDNLATQMADQFTFRSLNLNRVSEQARKTVNTTLRDVERDIVKALKRFDPGGTKSSVFQKKRLLKTQEMVDDAIKNGYKQISRDHRQTLRDVAKAEEIFTRTVYNKAVGIDLLNISPTIAEINALETNLLLEGGTVQDWWKRQSVGMRERFRDEMRRGLFIGESTNELLRRVRGTREKKFKDGITGLQRRSAERVVRTSVNSISNAAREEVFTKNNDVVRGVEALATLDLRTSEICMARSGSMWDLETGQPLPESPRQETYPGAPPWHWNCRTTLISVLKSYEELFGAKGKQFDRQLQKIGPGTQASMDGQVAGDMTFADWAKRGGEGRVREVLGPGRYDLWKKSKLAFTDLINQKGRGMTLAELREVS